MSIELNIRNTVFNTYNDEFPLEINTLHITFYLVLYPLLYMLQSFANHWILNCELKSRKKIEK